MPLGLIPATHSLRYTPSYHPPKHTHTNMYLPTICFSLKRQDWLGWYMQRITCNSTGEVGFTIQWNPSIMTTIRKEIFYRIIERCPYLRGRILLKRFPLGLCTMTFIERACPLHRKCERFYSENASLNFALTSLKSTCTSFMSNHIVACTSYKPVLPPRGF